MMYNVRFALLRFIKIFILLLLLMVSRFANAQTTAYTKLPQSFLIKFINSTDKFEVNHATAFKHAYLPEKYHDVFLSYIKDSVSAEIPGLASVVYYSLTLKDGKIINGDIYWNESKSYIIFKIDDKKYVNYFTKEGVAQIKTLFKL